MSIINQMLRDLEKRRPQGMTLGAQGTIMSPPGVVGNILLTSPAKRSPWRAALWILPLLALGLSIGILLIRPTTLETMEMTPPAHVMPNAPTLPNQPIPIRPVSDPMMQGNPLPIPSPVIISEHELATTDNNAITSRLPMKATPPPITPLPILPMASLPAPESTTQFNPLPLRSVAVENELQPIAPSVPTQLPANQIHAPSQEAVDASIPNKRLKETTPAQQAENEYRKAVGLLQQGRMARAMEILAQALQLDGSHAAARQTLVGLLVETKRFDEAEQRLQEGLKVEAGIDANRPSLTMMLARLQVERGDAHAGLETLQRGLPDVQENAAEHADYQAFLAALLQREGRHGEAIGHYLQALSKTPQAGKWLLGIGLSLQAENRMQDAQDAFARAKASNTLSPELLAFVEQRLKQIKR